MSPQPPCSPVLRPGVPGKGRVSPGTAGRCRPCALQVAPGPPGCSPLACGWGANTGDCGKLRFGEGGNQKRLSPPSPWPPEKARAAGPFI